MHVYSKQFCILCWFFVVVHLLCFQIPSFIGAIDFSKYLSTEKLPLAHKNKSEIIIQVA